ncbi:hypothetical protein PQG02_31770 (plasmid) [Nostoc sp. UHCC 0926]|nr:hypothetical protein PQG02_31770 [Nostoc sp. UHCC 0926]
MLYVRPFQFSRNCLDEKCDRLLFPRTIKSVGAARTTLGNALASKIPYGVRQATSTAAPSSEAEMLSTSQ